jgi:type VI secretion system protein ImpH
LEAILTDFFSRPVRVEQFCGRWLPLAAEERTSLGTRAEPQGRFCQLGTSATVGARVWDVQSSFRLHIGPLDYQQFIRFMPDGAEMKQLAELTELYVGQALGFDVRLTLKKEAVPMCRLAGPDDQRPRLGWNTWLKQRDFLHDASDAVFLR